MGFSIFNLKETHVCDNTFPATCEMFIATSVERKGIVSTMTLRAKW